MKNTKKKVILNLINNPDIAQTIAVALACTNTSFRLDGLQTLKIKETDRIKALQKELKKLNININCTNDSICYEKQKIFKLPNSINIDTYNDHRMAMSFAPLSLLIDNVKINNSEVVKKSYPNFWEEFLEVQNI